MVIHGQGSESTQELGTGPYDAEAHSPQPQLSQPQFATAVRGYDRAQVDDYLERIHQWLEEAEARNRMAEDTASAAVQEAERVRRRLDALEEHSALPTPKSMTAFGDRIGQILQAAVDAAQELRTQAENEARSVRDSALADREAVLARAQGEGQEIIEGAHQKERAVRQQIANLAAKRAAALGELGRIQERLAELVSGPEGMLEVGRGESDEQPAIGSVDATSQLLTGADQPAIPSGGDPPTATGEEPPTESVPIVPPSS